MPEKIALPNISFILGKTMPIGGTADGNASFVCIVTLYSCVYTAGHKLRPNRPFILNLDDGQRVKVRMSEQRSDLTDGELLSVS